MDQGLELGFWLGIAGFGIGLAHILLWRTRRVLSRSGKVTPTPEIEHLPAAVTRGVRFVPAGVKKSAGSGIAS